MHNRLPPQPSPAPNDWPESWSLPPRETPFDNLKLRHELMVQESLKDGWREPANADERTAVVDMGEELLRRYMPEYAARDAEGYGEKRSKALYHHVLFKPGRNRPNEAGEGFQCQLLLEARDRDGRWICLDAQGETLALRNAICMHVRGTDQGIEYLALHYSEAALTECLFAAGGDANKIPRHLHHELKSGLDTITGRGGTPPDLSKAELDWRKREIRIPATDGNYSVLLEVNEAALVNMRFFFTATPPTPPPQTAPTTPPPPAQ